LGSSGL